MEQEALSIDRDDEDGGAVSFDSGDDENVMSPGCGDDRRLAAAQSVASRTARLGARLGPVRGEALPGLRAGHGETNLAADDRFAQAEGDRVARPFADTPGPDHGLAVGFQPQGAPEGLHDGDLRNCASARSEEHKS